MNAREVTVVIISWKVSVNQWGNRASVLQVLSISCQFMFPLNCISDFYSIAFIWQLLSFESGKMCQNVHYNMNSIWTHYRKTLVEVNNQESDKKSERVTVWSLFSHSDYSWCSLFIHFVLSWFNSTTWLNTSWLISFLILSKRTLALLISHLRLVFYFISDTGT